MNQNQKWNDLTQGSISRRLILFFLPIAAGTVFQQLYNTVDTMVVGRFVGREALAAVGGSASQIITLCIGFFVALTGGASAVIAQWMGARMDRDVSRAVHSALSFSILSGLGLTLLGLPLTPTLLDWMKTPPDTLAQSSVYLRFYLSGTVFVLLFNMGSAILRAAGDSRRPFYALTACCLCNIALDLLFVAVMDLGVAGAALATVLSQGLSALLVLQQLCRAQEAYRVTLSSLRLHPQITKKLLRVGIPAGMQESMYNLSNLILQIALNSLGTAAVAGWSVAGKLDGIYVALSSSLGAAVMSFAGQNFGAGKLDRVRSTLRRSMVIFQPLTLIVGALLLFISVQALWLFTDDPAVMTAARQILWMLVPFYFVWTVIEGVGGVLRGVGDAVVPFAITCAGVCAVRLCWVLFIFPHWQTMMGLLFCWPLSWVLTAIAMLLYYRRGKWLSGPCR